MCKPILNIYPTDRAIKELSKDEITYISEYIFLKWKRIIEDDVYISFAVFIAYNPTELDIYKMEDYISEFNIDSEFERDSYNDD